MAASAALNQQLEAASGGLYQVMSDNQIALDSVNYTYQGIGTPVDTQALGEQDNSVGEAAAGKDWNQAWGDVLQARALLEEAYQAFVADPTNEGDPEWLQLNQQAAQSESAPVITQVFRLIADDEYNPKWSPPSDPPPAPNPPTPQPIPPKPKPIPVPSPVPPSVALARTVLKLAVSMSKDGQTVGDGSCWAFVQTVLDDAGAKDSYDFDPNRVRFDKKLWPHFNYVWGDPVSTLTPASHSTIGIQKGDIVQTSGVKASWYPQTPPPPGYKYTKPFTYGGGHHSAIVGNVSGNILTLIEQGTPLHGPPRVWTSTLNLDGLQRGTIYVYSPVAK